MNNTEEQTSLTTADEVINTFAGYFEGSAHITQDFPNAASADVKALENYMWNPNTLSNEEVVKLGNRIFRSNIPEKQVIGENISSSGSEFAKQLTNKEAFTARPQNDSSITDQLITHLRSMGINVKNRAEMEEYLKHHKVEGLQQAIAGSQLTFAHGVREPMG